MHRVLAIIWQTTLANYKQYDIGVAVELSGNATDVHIIYRQDRVQTAFALEAAETFELAMTYLLGSEQEKPDESLYEAFFYYRTGTSRSQFESAWRTRLEGLEASPFPVLPYPGFQPQPDTKTEYCIRNLPTGRRNQTDIVAVLWTAWATLAAAYTSTNDVVFGGVIPVSHFPSSQQAGRVSAPPSVLPIVPIRIQLNNNLSIAQVLRETTDVYDEITLFRYTSQQWIRDIGENGERACALQTVLQIHDAQESMTIEQGVGPSHPYDQFALWVSCYIQHDTMYLQIRFDTSVIDPVQIKRIASQFGCIIRQLCSTIEPTTVSMTDIQTISEEDQTEIWSWNATVPEAVEMCVHDMIAVIVAKHPTDPAICAWDGDLTYQELDALSTTLACHLAHLGAGPGSIIPLCFEKSKWMAVAMLGIMKAGAASVAMDITHPEARLQTIVEQAYTHSNCRLIISSRLNEILSQKLARAGLGDSTVVIPETLVQETAHTKLWRPANVRPEHMLYVVFTSGSTGTPKGAIVSHRNFSSAILHQKSSFGFTNRPRVLDFSSYAFGAAWFNFIHTLACGGCLCVPSEDERKTDIMGAITRLKVTYAVIIPTVARSMRQTDVPTLKRIVFAGEKLHQADVLPWRGVSKIYNGYGCAECTVAGIVGVIEPGRISDPSIGRGSGCVTWVVRLDGAALAAIGEIGELWIEGPIVGQGYLGDPEKTADVFIENPPWMLRDRGLSSYSRRHGRLYRTGDLVRYNSDGTLHLVGRRDDQVKINGQRIQLGDVEHHLRSALDSHPSVTAVAEVAQPSGSNIPLLVAFLALTKSDSTFEALVLSLSNHLVTCLPAHMVPAAYIPVDEIPLTGTGKTDRRHLRNVIRDMTIEQLADLYPARSQRTYCEPSTDIERRLQQLWASILGVSPASISAHDSFFGIGGDSVSAMRLVATAREHELLFSVADIFRCPRLTDLADCLKADHISIDPVAPFSLIRGNEQDIRAQASIRCQIPQEQVLDVFPCTQLQQGLLAITARRSGYYVARNVYQLAPSVDIARFHQAWQQVVNSNDILRTRIADLPGQGLVQIVSTDLAPLAYATSLSEYLEENKHEDMGLGSALTYAALVQDNQTRCHYFVWTIHHALYDGWSLPLLIDCIVKSYNGNTIPATTPFQVFVRLISELDQNAAANYWRSQLDGCDAATFPSLPFPTFQPRSDKAVSHSITSLSWPQDGFTPANIIRTAWAILQARHCDSTDVVFGAVVSGRQSSLPQISQVIGPTIATVPVRLRLDQQTHVKEALQQVQDQAVDMLPYEQFGLSRIRDLGETETAASDFQCLLVVQPKEELRPGETGDSMLLEAVQNSSSNGLQQFNTYALTVICDLHNEGLELTLIFDREILEPGIAKRMADQFEVIMRQLCNTQLANMKVSDLASTGLRDLTDIWSWNSVSPEPMEACVHDLFADVSKRNPNAPAICAWDGNLTYRELDNLSTTLACYLTSLGIGSGTIIPLYFEKSLWMPVAMLGVMKTGAASVAMDTNHPEARLRGIINQVHAQSTRRLILSSMLHEDRAHRLANTGSSEVVTVVVVESIAREMTNDSQKWQPTKTRPEDILYIVFTSGSTGRPKGVVISHSNFSSAIYYQRTFLGFQNTSRLFDFVSYAFDVAWCNLLHTITAGGCLCIPSDHDRQNDVIGSFQALKASSAILTPTIWGLLRGHNAPIIETAIATGEKLPASVFSHHRAIAKIHNAYGPAECTVFSTIAVVNREEASEPSIGKGCGMVTWVVRPEGTALAGVGEVGELWLEGPLVGQGYLGSPDKTMEAFIEDPPWLMQGGPAVSGRRGRLYRTGDLVRYDSDGAIHFLRRKDDQVKLRGQRIELGDVEHHVACCLSSRPEIAVIAEVAQPSGASAPLLVAFLTIGEVADGTREEVNAAIGPLISLIGDNITDYLPTHMVPTYYIAIRAIPLSGTGKADRSRLRDIIASMTTDELAFMNTGLPQGLYRELATDIEYHLRQLWASILYIDPHTISAQDNFFRVGGDSIAAMRLVASARDNGLSLSVADIFKHPSLRKLAAKAVPISSPRSSCPVTFSLMDIPLDRITPTILPHYPNIQIIDMFPTTDFQQQCIQSATSVPLGQTYHFFLDFTHETKGEQLVAACHKLWDQFDILRTIFVCVDGRHVQVIPQGLPLDISLNYVSCPVRAFQLWCSSDRCTLQFGRNYVRMAVFQSPEGTTRLALRLCHAQYDGFMLHQVVRYMAAILNGRPLPEVASFSEFMQHINVKRQESIPYWRHLLDGSSITRLVYDKATVTNARPIKYTMIVPAPRSNSTAASTFIATCAFAVSMITQTDDLTLGVVVSGRIMTPRHMVVGGPCVNIVPVRVQMHDVRSLIEASQMVQQQRVDGLAFEASQFSDISRECTTWDSIDSFGFVLQFQNIEEQPAFEISGSYTKLGVYEEYSTYNLPSISILARPIEDKWEMTFTASSAFYQSYTIQLLASTLETIVRQESNKIGN